MFSGNSLTRGVGDTNTVAQGGYRNALMRGITARLALSGRIPRFVGSDIFAAGPMCGTSGLRIDEIYAAPYSLIQVPQYKPDVIIYEGGMNDSTQLNTGGVPLLATSRANLTTQLNFFRTTLPNVKVIIATLNDNQNAHTEVLNFNTNAINTDCVARTDYASGLLKISDVYTALGLYSATYWAASDPTHLNALGYAIVTTTHQAVFNTWY